MREGYTKRWRKRWDKGYHKDLLLWALMDYFIDHAAYKTGKKYLKQSGVVHLRRGECIFGTRSLSDFFGVGRQQIRHRIKLLREIGFISTLRTTRLYSVATILNYDKYNPLQYEAQPAKQPAEQPTNNPQTTHRQPDRIKDNKEKERERITTLGQNGFGTFWTAYPRKRKKGDAESAWKSLLKAKKLPEINTILTAIEKFKTTDDWTKENGQFIPYPATWLRAFCWEDEILTTDPYEEFKNEQRRIQRTNK